MLSTFCDYINIISPSLEGKEPWGGTAITSLPTGVHLVCVSMLRRAKRELCFLAWSSSYFYVKKHLKCLPTQGKPKRTTQVWVSIEPSDVLMLLMLIQHCLKQSISQDTQTGQTWALVQPRSACSRQSVPDNKHTLHPHTKKKDAFYKNNESQLKCNTP